MTLEDGTLRLEGVQHATEEEQRTGSSRANEVVGPKPKGCSAVDVPGSEMKGRCSKEIYCIGTWNVRSMNLGKKTLMLGKSEGKRRKGRQRTRWMDSVIEATNMNLTKLWEAVEDRRVWRAVVQGVTKSQTKQQKPILYTKIHT